MTGDVQEAICPLDSAGSPPAGRVGRKTICEEWPCASAVKCVSQRVTRAASSSMVASNLTSKVCGQKNVAPCDIRKVEEGSWQSARFEEVGSTKWEWCVGPKLQVASFAT